MSTGKKNTVTGDNKVTVVDFRQGCVSGNEAARYLGITQRELKGLRARKALAFYRIGHRTVTYRLTDLDAFLARNRVAPEGESVGKVA